MQCGEDYFLSEKEKNEKVSGKFLYAVTDFSIFKKDEAYWLEYIGNDTYVGRSDNILNQKVEIAPRHLVWYFSEKPRSAFEKELADWFYGMRTWGLDVGDVGCEAFCDSQAHKAAKRLLMYAPTLNDDDMTQEEKQLLLKDLCARLPYGVKINIRNDYTLAMEDIEMNAYHFNTISYDVEYRGLRPYLRPLSSMTEEEKTEYYKIVDGFLNFENAPRVVDWLNAHYFDYRGLIEQGLALEAPEGMYI